VSLPICVECELEMRCAKNGCTVEEMADFGSYRLVSGDLYECPNCNVSVVVGRALTPLAEHFQGDYSHRKATADRPIVRAWTSLREMQEFEALHV
jgi:hypothetical protein